MTTPLWDSEQLFFEADTYYEDLLTHIHNARHNIIIETYIFDYDAIGRRFIDALAEARNRGVNVRVMMDGAGTYEQGHRTATALESAGIEVKIFRPLPWQIHHYQRAVKQGKWSDKLLYFLTRINQRNHRKLFMVDNHWLWSGSLNISRSHLSREAGGDGWRDYGVRVSGGMITDIASQFDDYWYRRPRRPLRHLFGYYWNTLSDWTRVRRNQLLLEHISQAEQRIWLVAAYFAPARSVVRALLAARARGVDVKITVAGKSDVFFFPLLTATYYADLLKNGIEVYEYQQSVLHAKALIIDELHLVGSTNFNHRSYLHDLELDIELRDHTSQQTLRDQMQSDQQHSLRIGQQIERHRRWRYLGWLPRLLRYWL